jgi:predicted acyl esterase
MEILRTRAPACSVVAALLVVGAPVGAQTRSRDLPPRAAASSAVRLLPPVRHDLFIQSGAESLDATVYFPSDPPADTTGYPGILFVHGFGESKDADTLDALFWAQSGYVSLCYSVRGQGNSSGGTTIMGPAERQDLARVIAFMRSLPGIDSSRIGVQGSSQGGAHVLWAVADSLPIEAGVADVITPGWASNMLANGSVRTTLALLLRTDGVRYDPVRDTLWGLLRDDDYESLRRKFIPSHDIDTARLHRSRIPLATFVKWQDHYFSAEDGLESYLRQRGSRKIYAGTGGHYSDNVLPELVYQWEIIGAWMEQFVGGWQTGVLDRPPLTFAFSSLPMQEQDLFTWTHEELSVWPPPGVRAVKFYLNRDSALTPEMPALDNGVQVVRNNWSGTYPLDSGFVDGFHGTRFNRNLPRESLAFTSAPLSSDCFWVGSPTMHLYAASFYSRFPLHVQIFEVDEGGTKRFINRIPFTARGWMPGSVAAVQARGFMHAHRFTRGNRIRIELSNIDGEAKFQWGNVPFTVPMFGVASVGVFMDLLRPSYVELPMLGDPGIPNAIQSLTAVYDRVARLVRITWRTPAEWNNRGFVVERSDNGTSGFNALGTVPPAAGPTSSAPAQYAFVDTNRLVGRWWYRLCQNDAGGTGHLSAVAAVDVVLDVAEDGAPHMFRLDQNFPNPFNPATEIAYEIPRSGQVTLAVYDLLGQEIASLVNHVQSAGRYSVRFDGSHLASGTYLCRLQAGGSLAVRRMLIIK